MSSHLHSPLFRLWWASGKRSDCFKTSAGFGQSSVHLTWKLRTLYSLIFHMHWAIHRYQARLNSHKIVRYQWSQWIHPCHLTAPLSGVVRLLSPGCTTKGRGGEFHLQCQRVYCEIVVVSWGFLPGVRAEMQSRWSLQVDDYQKLKRPETHFTISSKVSNILKNICWLWC